MRKMGMVGAAASSPLATTETEIWEDQRAVRVGLIALQD
ncbi:hypothetical protein ACVMHZ_010199 [Bradyrhizobium liaoningense]